MSDDRSGDWSLVHRVVFRFLFLYWVLYNVPQQGAVSIFDVLPWGAETIDKMLAWPLQHGALWLGSRLFHLQGIVATFHLTGSGDTALNYVLVFIIFVLALFGTALWSLLDRRRMQYRTLDAWLRLFVSLALAVTLLGYGFAKIWPGQFGPPFLARLNETYGESSPMALLWTFMGGSRWYAMFGGIAEAVPALLLFFRRTRTLGALLAAGVMLNVMLLNFCYDVPVKLYSTHLVLMCVFLLAPDMPALLRLFLFRGQAQLRTDHVPAPERRWIRRTGYALLALVVAGALYGSAVASYQPYPRRQTELPLYGYWKVEHAASTVKDMPWTAVIVENPEYIAVQRADGNRIRLPAKIDATQHTIAVTSPQFGNGELRYTPDPADPRRVALTGSFNHGQVRFDLHRTSPDSYPLLTRGFHWVSEFPYNR